MTPSDRFPDIQDLIAEIERGGPYASIDDVNRLLTERTSAYNARPQAELGGLSPDQMAALLYGDWKSTGALRLNEDLPLGELAGSDVLADARTILSWVRDHGHVKETTAHNLPPTLTALVRSKITDELARAELISPGTRRCARGSHAAPHIGRQKRLPA